MKRKFNFKTILAMVTSSLRTKNVSQDIGASLTDDQRNTILEAFGENFTSKFEEALESENSENFITDLQSAMREFFAPEARETTDQLANELRALRAENERLNSENTRNREAIATLMEEPETIPAADNPLEDLNMNSQVPNVLRINANAQHYARATSYLLNGVAPAGAATIEVTELRQEFGTYLSQNRNNLEVIRQLFNGFTSSQHFRTVPATTEYRAVQSMINSVVQQFKPKWTPKGNTKFTPLRIKNFRHKINVPIVPAEVIDSYMFHLYDESLSPAQMPISKYIINQLILPRILDDIELRMIFKGKYVESNDDEATPAEDSMDGIETLLINEKANVNTRVNFYQPQINLATASAEEIVKHVEGFADFVDDKLKIKTIYASKFFKKKYQRAYEEYYGGGAKVVGGMNKTAEVDYVEMEITALDGMGNSPILYATVPGNQVKLRHINEAPNIVNKVVEGHYNLDIVGEFWLGAGFAIAEALFASVPDNYDPQAGLKPDSEFPDGTIPGGDGSSGSAGGSEGGGI